MTPEQEKVIEAATELIRGGRQCLGHWEGSKFIERGEVPLVPGRWDALDDAVRAYRKSLEPQPRYTTKPAPLKGFYTVKDGKTKLAVTWTQEDAERIAALLNQEEK